ncbi:MAG: citrate/2-methylcitrate synthase [Clostridia bacterium]|nr:citrate/2-methylcitrate synthase [Clostridia bacterium]
MGNTSLFTTLCDQVKEKNRISPEKLANYEVKRGLRNADGTGVLAGLTNICNVHGYVLNEGEKTPVEGELTYRGYNINDLVNGTYSQGRFGFEEVAFLLLFGSLPTAQQAAQFTELLSNSRELPEYFAEDMILKAPSPNIMNKIARSVLVMYSYDDNPDDTSVDNVLRQCIGLIAMLPTILGYSYQVKRRHYDKESMYFHPLLPGLSTSETILRTIRADATYTPEEARLLDLCLMLHAEHGGGNNSAFAARVLSSSGTDTYAAISAAVGSLKGHRHGGANLKVVEMLEDIKLHVRDWNDEDEIAAYLAKMLRREAGDGSGLIYGMGHAVYTLSDPRAVILKREAARMAEQKGFGADFRLLETVERLTPAVAKEVRGLDKALCANVDMYSGLVYRSLGISDDLFTPLFATARIVGWCAHRIEELLTGGRIIRPAYKPSVKMREYIPLENR